MKTLFKIAMSVFLLTAVLSCTKKDTVPGESYTNSLDSTDTSVDTVGPGSDSVNTSTDGTTGAVGEGSTGSGTAGSTQKGAVQVKTDSVSVKKGR